MPPGSRTPRLSRRRRADDGFAEFCRREGPRLAGSLTVVTGDAGEAEDLAQEALVRACERWGRLRHMDSPEGWLYRVAFNLMRSRWRRVAVARRRSAELAAGVTADDPADEVAEVLVLREALGALSQVERDVVVLRFCADLSVASVAEALGLSASAVKTHTQRGLVKARHHRALHGRVPLDIPEEPYVRY